MNVTDKLKTDIQFIKQLVAKNGPDLEDYEGLNKWYTEIGVKRESKQYTDKDIDFLREQFEDTYLSSKALQGFVYMKPHGYRGDFEIIDKIYQKYITPNPKFSKWDTWFHTLAATKAVRNRKEYFKMLLEQKSMAGSFNAVLNLASGPCRDLVEFFETQPESNIHFDCVEIDQNAVQFAKELLRSKESNVNFILRNVFRFVPTKKYDLIWSAGLFDYFDDKVFVGILKRYKQSLLPNGEIVIGNFHPSNTSKSTMEFGLWYLHHRNEHTLKELAVKAGYQKEQIFFDKEEEGVNLFMRIKN